MASINFKNNAFSTITFLAQGETTLTVIDETKFPTEVPFVLTLWDSSAYSEVNDDPNMEIVIVTAVSGTDFTVTRGAEDTSDVTHASGTAVDMLWTAGIMNDPVRGVVTKLDAAVEVTANHIATAINASAEVFNDANIASTIARDSEVTDDIATHTALPNAHHNESHSVASHNDTTATGAELEVLTDGSNADGLHVHGINDTHRTSDGSDHTFIDQSVISGASPTLVGTNITAIPSANINFNVLGTPTYKTAQDWFNVIQTAGIISGFELSNSRSATELDVAAGTGIIKTTDSEIGSSVSLDFAGVQNVTLTSNNINYIYLDYNAGTPQIVATTNRASIELNRHFIIGRVYKCDSTLCVLNAGVHLPNIARNEHERLVERDGFTYSSGAITSETGTLNLAVTAGVWFLGHNRLTTNALDSSVTDTWIYTHYGVSSWITDNATATAVDCTHYNDGTDVLASLGSNNYGVQWTYISTDSHWYVIYDTINGTLSTAQAATPPTSIPAYLEHMGELLAKIIHKQDGTIVSIEIAQDVEFTTSGVPNHNDTGGLQGGTANEYYHLTSAEKTLFDTVETNAAADQTASEVPIVDSGSIITATDVEDALQENRIAIDLNTAKDTNVTTNLSEGTNTETTVDVNSSDGTNATLVSASTLRAGLLTKAKFDEIVANNAKVTNATHTGEVTGATSLTVDKTAITSKGAVTAVETDYVLISDTGDSGNLKKALVSDFGAAPSDAGFSIEWNGDTEAPTKNAVYDVVDSIINAMWNQYEKGYIMGGNTGAKTVVIEDIIFSNETSQAIAATLDTAKIQCAGVNNSTKGYVMGGDTGSVSNVIEDIIFADETSQAIGATLDTAKTGGAGINSTTKGYIVGGKTTVAVAVIEDLIFTTEASQAIAATLDTARYHSGGVNSATKGYVMGGRNGGNYTLIDDFIFTTEASQEIAATLNAAKFYLASFNSAGKGYISGGTGQTDVIEDLIFADETSQVITATLTTGTEAPTGVNSGIKGYTVGGYALSAVIDSLLFSSETTFTVTATLDTAKYSSAGVQSGSV